MKKKVLFVAALFIGATTFAQDGLTSKKGEAILPEAGDWAIGFDANPLLGYFGNLANGTTNNSFAMPWVANSNAAITGKMFKDETTAYRAKVRLGFLNSSSSDFIYEQTLDGATTPTEFTNTTKTSNMNIIIGGGIEKRRGSTRLQGFYGGEVLIGFGNTGTTTTDYGITVIQDSTNLTGMGNARTTEIKGGSTFTVAVRGFIGAEYFFAPKMSIAVEYGYGLAMQSTGGGSSTVEYWGIAPGSTATTNSAQTQTTNTGGSSSMYFDNDNGALNNALVGGNATLTLLFHF